MSVFFIAEAGVNHNGDRDIAFRLVDAAAAAGADAVKFQTFSAEALASETAPKAAYQNETTDAGESQLDMLRRLELSHALHVELRDYCATKNIAFMSSPFDLDSVRFLAEDLKLPTLKVPSGEITNGPFLLEVARTGCGIILSTGMSTLDEVRTALGVLAFAMTDADGAPSLAAFEAAFASYAGYAALSTRVAVLHCTSAYPTPPSDANLRAMVTLRDTFGLKTGYSDHTEGTACGLAAAALGAEIIEKHFTLDKSLPGPDHKASLDPAELAAYVAGIRTVEAALGDGIKEPRPSELDTRDVARKSLVALRPIAAGDTFTADNLGAKRPGTGVPPMHYWEHLGEPAPRDIEAEELV
ncbi:MAG: N-acetylneuraminate synthase [Rhodospirillales bacterium]